MNIFRPQRPYTFCPARYSRWLSPGFMVLSKWFYLNRHFKIRDIQVFGEKAVSSCIQKGHSVLIAPNHADHADPHVLLQASRICRTHFHFMAAREGFEQSPVNRFVLQRMGAFSIDREGADLAAIKQAIQVLEKAAYPLVIFPEGEIWHHHETLDEVNEGVANILLKVFQRVSPAQDAVLVPTGLRYFHEPHVERTFDSRLAILERSINWAPSPNLAFVDRILRLCTGLLATKEVEYLGQNLSGTLLERRAAFQAALVEGVESVLALTDSSMDSLPGRVKKARQKIRTQLTQGEGSPSEIQQAYLLLDRLYLVIQLYSYPGQYLAQEPSVDRIAETILKLEEDVLGKGSYPAPRRVEVRFGDPISVSAFLKENGLNAKSGAPRLTDIMAGKIQELLDGQKE